MNKRIVVYVCKKCDLLLLKVNGVTKKTLGFCATLNDSAYSDDDIAEEIESEDSYFCPACESEVVEKDAFLVPMTAIPKLVKLWNQIQEYGVYELEDCLYGIPLNDDMLAEIMTEHLL